MLVVVDELYSIGEFSERCGLSPKMLRNYASAGTLVPAAVDSSSGYRYYSPGQLHDARVIGLLRRAGISVGDISSFLPHPTAARLEQWENDLGAELQARQDALREVRELLAFDGLARQITKQRPQQGGGRGMAELVAASATDVGKVRATNEDAVLTEAGLMAVADGLGGHVAGEVASHTAIEGLRSAFTGDTIDHLRDAVRGANKAVWDKARTEPRLEGMGTTLCAAALVEVDGRAHLGVVNIGDSRAYLLRDGELAQLTDDHSVVAELVRQGELSEDDARDHPQHSILTRVLGMGPDVEPDSVVVPLCRGDRILLCTDGLTNELENDEMASILKSVTKPGQAARRLVQAAMSAGGHDNISVVVLDVAGLKNGGK